MHPMITAKQAHAIFQALKSPENQVRWMPTFQTMIVVILDHQEKTTDLLELMSKELEQLRRHLGIKFEEPDPVAKAEEAAQTAAARPAPEAKDDEPRLAADGSPMTPEQIALEDFMSAANGSKGPVPPPPAPSPDDPPAPPITIPPKGRVGPVETPVPPPPVGPRRKVVTPGAPAPARPPAPAPAPAAPVAPDVAAADAAMDAAILRSKG